MKHYIKLFLLLSIFTTACKHKNQPRFDEVVKIKIELKKSNQTDVSQILKNIELIPLETTEKSVFGEVKRIRANDSYLYILDYNNNPIKMFNKKNGKFVSEIGHKGAGPGEYVQITDFLINNDTIYIFAWNGNKKWIRYSSDNQFLYETSMSFPFSEICLIGDNRYIVHVGNGTVSTESDYYLYNIDKNFGVLSKLMPKKSPEDINFPIQQNHFSKTEEHILYIREYCDTLFTISQDFTIHPKYHLDFGNNWCTKQFLKEYYDKPFFEIYNAIDKNEFVKHVNVWETNTQLIISYIIQHEIPLGKRGYDYLSIYFKETGEIYNYKNSRENILTKLIIRPYWADDSQITGLISSEELLDIADEISPDDPFAQKIKKCAEQINEFANPILVMCRFK